MNVKKTDVKKTDLVSVIMGVYNTDKNYLIPAIESILNQTYENLEFIIVNDCSEKWCTQILEDYRHKDNRIVLINNQANLGITKTLNIGLERCRGTYVARMDSDDVSLPQRIERQVDYLEKHRNVNVLACCAGIYEEGEETYLNNKYHIDPEMITRRIAGIYRCFNQERIRVRLSFGNIEFTHPTVMYRKSFLDKYSIRYDESLPKAQDYAMWTRVQEYRCMNVLQEVLLVYRDNPSSSTNSCADEQTRLANVTKLARLKSLIDEPSEEMVNCYNSIDNIIIRGSAEDNISMLKSLVDSNKDRKIYPNGIYKQELYFRMLRKGFYKCNRGVGRAVILHILGNAPLLMITMFISYIKDIIYNNKMSVFLRDELHSTMTRI